MATLPSSLALTSIADGSNIVAGDHRNNYAALQTWANALLTLLSSGTSGQVLTSGGGTTVSWALPAILVKYTTLIDIVSSTTETDVLQAAGYTVPAGVLGTSGVVRITIPFDYKNNTGGSVNETIRVYFGGTVAYASAGINLGTSANRHSGIIRVTVANLGSASSQHVSGEIGIAASGTLPTTGLGQPDAISSGYMPVIPIAASAPLSIDTTSSQVVRVTWQHDTSGVNVETRVRHSLVEIL